MLTFRTVQNRNDGFEKKIDWVSLHNAEGDYEEMHGSSETANMSFFLSCHMWVYSRWLGTLYTFPSRVDGSFLTKAKWCYLRVSIKILNTCTKECSSSSPIYLLKHLTYELCILFKNICKLFFFSWSVNQAKIFLTCKFGCNLE